MARRHDLVGLTVLAILSVRASHPYELHRFIIYTHKDYVTGLPRSLYHAVERLARDELITPTKTDREGRRPERTVYEITDEGRRELSTRLRRLLEEPEPDRRTLVAPQQFGLHDNLLWVAVLDAKRLQHEQQLDQR